MCLQIFHRTSSFSHEWDNLVTLIINVVNKAHMRVVTDRIHQIYYVKSLVS